MKTDLQDSWKRKLETMTDEEIVRDLKNNLPKDKTPHLRAMFVKEYIKRYNKKESELKNDQ